MNNTCLARTRSGLMIIAIALTALLASCSDPATSPDSISTSGYDGTVATSDPVSKAEADSVRANADRFWADSTLFTIDQVIQIIRARYHNAEILGINLNTDQDQRVYEVVIRTGGQVIVVVINNNSGHVTATEPITNYYYPASIVITQPCVDIRIIRHKLKVQFDGEVVECNMQEIENRATYVIVIITREHRYVTIYIDAHTGKPCKVDDDDDDDDDNGHDCDNHDGKHKHKKGRGHYRHGKGHGYGHHYHHHCDCDHDDDDDDHGHDSDSCQSDSTAVGVAIITRDSAQTIAAGMFDSAQVTTTHLRVQSDSVIWYTVSMKRDSNTYKLTIDARTGMLVAVEQESGDFNSGEFTPTHTDPALIPLSQARAAALANTPGNVTDWTLEQESGKWVYAFAIAPTNGGPATHVVVDAQSGQIVRAG
ncbi:MAG: PepSY domain-containing protein [Chlorobi bacterium]|nr:MAG: Peptidase propeptide and YPEB domain protein [Chlorobi bacterium OLB7]MBK8911851.1 PepSY domain-containing protein [Chlorobiota bacterium]MBX7215507.1 PepSY domain-containing protein [Candidatus Kapabacteria bacterium]